MKGNNGEFGEIVLPWSPKITLGKSKSRFEMEEKANSEQGNTSITFSPQSNPTTQFPNRKVSFGFGDSEKETSQSEIDNQSESPKKKYPIENMPWSPQNNKLAKCHVAYIFGKTTDPVVQKIKTILANQYNVDLTLHVYKQPPKPFPLFYLYTEEYKVDKAAKVGMETSDGHFIYIKPEGVKETPSDKDIPILDLANNWKEDEKILEDLCSQMAEQTNKVYEHNLSNSF